jgi:hypothetical protein
MYRTVQISIGELSLVEDGLIYVKVFTNAEVTLDIAKEYHSVVAYLCEERPHSTVLDISGVTYVSKDAREWLQEHSSQWGKTVSAALITNSFTSKAIGNLVLTLSKPSFPVRLFESRDLAEQWARRNYSTYMACQEQLG